MTISVSPPGTLETGIVTFLLPRGKWRLREARRLVQGHIARRLKSWGRTGFFPLQGTFYQRGKETGLEICERKNRKVREKY